MPRISHAVLALGLAFASPALARDHAQQIQFDTGSSKTLRGALSGADTFSYTMSVTPGRNASVIFSSTNAACSFNVYRAGEDAPVFEGARNGNTFSGPAPRGGDYLVRVALAPQQAQNHDECRFAITFAMND